LSFSERERESSADIGGCNETLHPPSLHLFLFGLFFLFFLSFVFFEKREEEEEIATHAQKKKRDDGSAFFPLEKYLPLVSRKIKDENKICRDASSLLRFSRKKTNHTPFLTRSIFCARKIYIPRSNQHSRSIVRSKVEKIERRNFCPSGVNFVFQSLIFVRSAPSEARSEREKVFVSVKNRREGNQSAESSRKKSPNFFSKSTFTKRDAKRI